MVKILSEEDDQALNNYVIKASVQNALLGAVSGVGFDFGMKRIWPFYGKLPMGIRFSVIGSFFIATLAVRTEHQIQVYEKAMYGGDPEEEKVEIPEYMQKGGHIDRLMDGFLQNKYSVLGGAWAAVAGYSVYRLYQNKHITWTQRIVQARMYAQALTIVGILGIAGITALSNDRKKKQAHEEH
ncbi:Respiratory supercomplex factor 2, mitochondrial [Zancudomyces culisetae]|uniref:Respiratory supercomplex factor 2, mitochondrial n=1 Tax=Zancudomyces culisetae TaxID=1213189 RepID=A0A1R1PC75_ZANCU|nr:Respiratory supercomplex factor 2, mitochondrial [Zancudomyces culisetae]OMH85068.1 Respiratory supercomplex factor 2, mitochondrial [Zancudomyces culisetae]|eukprot:OMH78566.1 Respiratory supercomplex factor 2, mitochondrial [Zancudomyces culisetae]